MLPKMIKLKLENCHVAVGEALRRLPNSHAMATTGHSTFKKPRYSPLRELHCSNCGLTDKDLHIILSCFPNLEDLVVPQNEFVSLPASIKESGKLRVLDVSDYRMLEEIPELPTSILTVSAYRCPCLSSGAFKKLWSQASNEVYGLEFVRPRLTEIPDWFDHHDDGGIVSFWARGEFPVLAVAFIFGEHAAMKKINLYVNGYLHKSSRCHPPLGKNVSFFHLRRLFFDPQWSLPETFRVGEWNHVKIEIECAGEGYCDTRCNVNNCNVSSWGAYVYKLGTNMENIRFICPNLLKRTLSIVDDDDSPKRTRGEEAQA